MYAVGTGAQQDVLQAQVSVAQATADLVVLSQDRIATAARLNSLLGRPAAEPVGPVSLDLDADIPPEVDVLLEQASANRPALQAARQRTLAAEAGYRQAQRAVYPDITVTLGYGNRPEFVDLATLMVGVSLPIFAGSKQKRRREEMRVVRSMEEALEIDLYNETYARLGELRARAERARLLSDLYRTSILPQAAASVESALSAYQVGEVDYMTLLTNQMTVNRFRIERIRLAAEYGEAMAGIEALTGSNGLANAPANNGDDR
jgi:outer membrane protein TolC